MSEVTVDNDSDITVGKNGKFRKLAAAAIVALVAIGAWMAVHSGKTSPKEVTALAEGTAAGETKTITLPGEVKMELVWCPPGTFTMGEGATSHTVTLTKGFWLGKYEVTQRQWESVMGNNPSFFIGDARPAEKVSWDDCQKFVRRVRESTGLDVSLPTEAQWEYACRAGTTTPFSFGTTLNGDNANCCGNYPYGTSENGVYLEQTTDVGSYGPNAWGLYDMHGNVWEWCLDWYDDYGGNATDPTGPLSGALRVLRGGCWGSYARFCRSEHRGWSLPVHHSYYFGLRIACSASPRGK